LATQRGFQNSDQEPDVSNSPGLGFKVSKYISKILHTSQARNKVQFQKSTSHPSIRKIDEMRKCSCHPSEF
jgi:hypothetical protein